MKSCGPDASTLAFKSRGGIREATVTNKPDHRGEREISRKTIAQGRPGVPAHLWLLPLCFFVAQGAAGAAGTRLSLRPLLSWAEIPGQLGRIASREGGVIFRDRHAPLQHSKLF